MNLTVYKFLLTISIFILTILSSYSQTVEHIKNKYKNDILDEKELRITTNKAIECLQNKDYKAFRSFFPDDLSKNISEVQLKTLVDQLSEILKTEGVPKEENIVPSINIIPKGSDTICLNMMLYQFENKNQLETPYSKTFYFSFLKQYGANKIVGVYLKNNPTIKEKVKPQFEPIKSFNFKTKNVTGIRIYYDEGMPKKTMFNNNKGVFSVVGNHEIFKESKIEEKAAIIFNDLKKSKYEKFEIFNNTINRGVNPEYIQIEFQLNNKEYNIFLYMPIKNGGIYDDYIILQQRDYINLGYQYYLKKEDYKELIFALGSIKDMKLNKYYEANP